MTIAEQNEEARLALAEAAGLSTAAVHAILRTCTKSDYDPPQWAYVGLSRKRCVQLLGWRHRFVTHAPEDFAEIEFFDAPCHMVGDDPALDKIDGIDDCEWHLLDHEAVKHPDFRMEGGRIHLSRHGVQWSFYEKHVDTDIMTGEIPWSVIIKGSKLPKGSKGSRSGR